MANELVDAVRASAARLGVDPSDVLTVMSYETGGKLDPNLWGGKDGNHLGLIQFGGPERAKYGVRPGMAVGDQVLAAENFLRDRGLKPGMGLLDIYSTINAGRPGLYNRSDAGNGGAPGTVADKVASMAGHRARANALLGGTLQPPLGAPRTVSAPDSGSTAAMFGALAPGSSGTAATPEAGLLAALQAVQGLGQADDRAALPVPPIQYATPPGLARARALARAMGNQQLA